MRYFRCFDCGYFWKIIFWEDGKGTKLACPECKSLNVHRIERVQGWDREGKYTLLANDEDLSPTIPEIDPDRRVLMKEEILPPRNPAQKYFTSMISTIMNQWNLNGFIERFVKHSP